MTQTEELLLQPPALSQFAIFVLPDPPFPNTYANASCVHMYRYKGR